MPATWPISAMLLLMTFLSVFPLDVILPSLPDLASQFSTTTQSITASVALFAVVAALAQLLIGPASDRYGRKALFIACMAVAVMGAIGCTYANSSAAFTYAAACRPWAAAASCWRRRWYRTCSMAHSVLVSGS